jgi:UV DNA damage endonuclease
MPINVGYCCINNTLNAQGITTGRTMRKATFEAKGLVYASQLALANAKDLVTILRWNADNNIRVFRMGSGIFPWGSEYGLTDLPDYHQIADELRLAGDIAKNTGQRITAHPDHFVKLASANPAVVDNSIKDLELHSKVFDLMGLSATHYNAINIHVGMNFSETTAQRWIDNFRRLSPRLQARMVVENDDKESAFSIKQLHTYIHSKLGIPLTFHADYVFSRIDDFGLTIDVDLECKAKELALLKYRNL